MHSSNRPLVLSENEFLCHADGPDTWCNQKFDDYLRDIDSTPEPQSIRPVPGYPDYCFAFSSNSVLLLFAGDVVGYYNAPGAVCIREDHQRKGLGAELILYTAVEWCGGPPTEPLDEQMFSRAGWHAHRKAYRLGVSRGLIIPNPMNSQFEAPSVASTLVLRHTKILSKSQADKFITETLFTPGGTLACRPKERFDRGRYNKTVIGQDVPTHMHNRVELVWAERRRDSDGPYYALFSIPACGRDVQS